MRQGQVFSIFIGSPDDVDEERRAAKDVIEQFNQHAGRNLGVQLELRGWEDTLPAAGRPQALINKDVEQADIFIGLLWRRWGTPTDRFSSGFLEELTLARELREAGRLSDVWLFLKDLGDTSDPGDQLRQVLEFRTNLRLDSSLLYKTFAHPTDFRFQLLKYLVDYFTRIVVPTSAGPVGTPAHTTATTAPSLPEIEEARAGLATVLRSVESDPDYVQPVEAAVRLFVFSAAALYENHLPTETLGAHETQLLFANKVGVVLGRQEELLLLRTLVADTSDVKAGWSLLVARITNVELLLWALAASGTPPSVRSSALSLLADLEQLEYADRALDLLGDEDWSTQEAVLKVLGRHGTAAVIEKLDVAVAGLSALVENDAMRAVVLLRLRADPEAALAWLEGRADEDRLALRSELGRTLRTVSFEAAKSRLGSADATIREEAFKVIRRDLTDDELQKLRHDDSLSMRRSVFDEMLSRQISVDFGELRKALNPSGPGARLSDVLGDGDERRVLVDALKQKPLAALEEMMDWLSADGPLAYQALAELRLPPSENSIASDLETRFLRIRMAALTKFGLTSSDLAPELVALKDSIDKLQSFIEGRFEVAAVHALAYRPSRSALAIIEPLSKVTSLYQNELVDVLLDVLSIVGNDGDVPRLLEMVGRERTPRRLRALELALRLARGDEAMIRTLLENDDPAVKQAVLRHVLETSGSVSDTQVEKLLLDRDEGVRRAAVAYVVHLRSRDAQEALLAKYTALESYFYNVVAWLDRVLNAPEQLRAVYMGRLRQRVFEARQV